MNFMRQTLREGLVRGVPIFLVAWVGFALYFALRGE